MDILTIITIIGGIILTIGYLPQIRKLYATESTDGINNAFWYLIFSAVTITALNLIYTDAPQVLQIIQVINGILAGVVVIMVHIYRKEGVMSVIPVFILAFLVIIVPISPIEITQNVASIMIVVAYLSQLITLFKSSSVAGVAPSLYLLIAFGLAIMSTKMFVSEVSAYIITTEIINIVLLLACAGYALYFQRKQKIN